MAELPEPKTRELKRQTAEIKRSAQAVEQSAGELTDSADRRTVLSGDRTLQPSGLMRRGCEPRSPRLQAASAHVR